MRWLPLMLLTLGCGEPAGPTPDGGALPDGHLGSGPPISFAVFGDVRPPIPEDIFQYPTAIVTQIFTLAQSMGAQFIVGTGDYMNAFTSLGVDAQVTTLLKAESPFTGRIYLAMGNHECQTTTQSNCPNGNESPNVQAFLAKLAPMGTLKPYYRVDVPTPLGTAKFLFVAANAWSAEQESWLAVQAHDPTSYTFVIRHEPSDAITAPGVAPSDAVLGGTPLTVAFYGHVHEYRRLDAQHVISGNGGAMLSAPSGFFGFLLVQQLADGTLVLQEIDQATGMPVDVWRVTPAGQPAP